MFTIHPKPLHLKRRGFVVALWGNPQSIGAVESMKATRNVCGGPLVWNDANLQRVSVAAFQDISTNNAIGDGSSIGY